LPIAGSASSANAPIEPNALADALETARRQIGIVFTQQPAYSSKKNKITAAAILKSVERILASAKSEWNGPLLRALWPALEERWNDRGRSADHEEAWLITAGFQLRPGFGVVRDDLRGHIGHRVFVAMVGLGSKARRFDPQPETFGLRRRGVTALPSRGEGANDLM
jgi:hypothetical protein